MLTGREKKVLEALEPAAEANGVEIVTVEIMGSKKAPTIRVFIDTPNGVGFDELAAAQVWIDQIIDELDPFPGAYTMEVSSPGIDRPLRTLEHFTRFAGEQAQLTLKQSIEGRGRMTGTLLEPVGETINIDVDGTTYSVPLANIKRAHVIGTVDFGA